MNVVRVSRASLLATLLENREKHEREYTVARKGWLAKLSDAASSLVSATSDESGLYAGTATAKEFVDRARTRVAALAPPRHHLDAYERAIRMAEMSQDEVVELDAGSFDRLVMDNWEWKQQFASTTAAYTS